MKNLRLKTFCLLFIYPLLAPASLFAEQSVKQVEKKNSSTPLSDKTSTSATTPQKTAQKKDLPTPSGKKKPPTTSTPSKKAQKVELSTLKRKGKDKETQKSSKASTPAALAKKPGSKPPSSDKTPSKDSSSKLKDKPKPKKADKTQSKDSSPELKDEPRSKKSDKTQSKDSSSKLKDKPKPKKADKTQSKDSSPELKDEPRSKKSDKTQSKDSSSKLKDKPKPKKFDKTPSEDSSSEGIVTRQIEKTIEDFVTLLEQTAVESKEYQKAVKFMENSLYHSASFESIELLSKAYSKKKDFKNQIKALEILSASYPDRPESFHLLGAAYSNMYHQKQKEYEAIRKLTEEEEQEWLETIAFNKEKAIENFNQALKVDSKYLPTWKTLLEILMDSDPETEEPIHTRDSLLTVIDMLKKLRKFKKLRKKNYILLCEAYYDNSFFKQARKACAKSVKKNPTDPRSAIVLALSQENKAQMEKDLLSGAEKFKNSFFAQYKTALYFMKKEDPKIAIAYFESAHAIQPDHFKLNEIMAQYLFDQGEEEKSYKHFLKICLETKGRDLKNFKMAQSQLKRKGKLPLIKKFNKGIDECFVYAKKEKQKASSSPKP